MVELGEQPARLVDAVLEEGLGVSVQVALDEQRPDSVPQPVGRALVPLETDRGREMEAQNEGPMKSYGWN